VPVERVETLVIGGGQAGLAMSHMLSKRGLEHLVLERHRIAERWRGERWDGLRFQFPNWSVSLPDFPFRHADPDGFATPGEIADFIAAYAAFIGAPVRCGVNVSALRHLDGASGFIAETSDGAIEAGNVVVATGPYQRPRDPPHLRGDDGLLQLDASRYKNPAQLAPGAVLVVGSGASGAQIAEELLRAGRRVYLSVGQHRRMPRRYRGRDLIWWLDEMGLLQRPTEDRGPERSLPLISGAFGGNTIDFRQFAAEGVTLLGRMQGANNGVIEFAPDLAKKLAYGDASYTIFLDMMDAHVDARGLDMPGDPNARAVPPDPLCLTEPMLRLDLRTAGVGTVIWATGYNFDFGWIHLPVLNRAGEPVHTRGITGVPGMYFLGLQWLAKLNSSLLSGVGDDAAVLADHIAARSK
jgi:putative flavoprotein involved in K+ transport